MHDYRRLEVWQAARRLVAQLYLLTDSLPRSEVFGLTSQIRRAAVSIPSNIAEGAARSTDTDFRRFLGYAQGSAAEVETQLLLASDIGYLTTEQAATPISQLRQLRHRLDALARTLARSGQNTSF